MKNPFVDDEFLKQLHEYPEREIYAKVISLDLDENPIEEITGHVTQGTISIDGTSAVRRTCSLTMVADEIDINSYYWGLNTKIKLFVGLRNFIDPTYDDIIWFPQGIYLLTTFSTAQNVTNYTINLQGKDKMACLNGELGGVITALSVDFGKVDEEDVDIDGNGLGTFSSRKFYLKDIVTEAVHTYADEPYSNIYVRDLDELGLELFEYRGEKPMYTTINLETDEVDSFTLNGSEDMVFYDENGSRITNDKSNKHFYFDNMKEDELDPRMTTVTYGEDGTEPLIIYTKVKDEFIPHVISKIMPGDGVGYKVTNLIFAGELIGSVGQAITTAVLDPIVKQLGDFEYFYDDEGKFIFQRKRTFVNTSWNNLVRDPEGDTYAQAAAATSTHTYSFDNSYLIQTFNNTPALGNVKNDFSVWGERQGISKTKIPIHMRYAIDKKPKYYTSINHITYTTRSEEEVEEDKKNFELDLKNGYQKEPSRFGLSEDWWEVRDWANAWVYSGLPVPTEALGRYCPEKAIITPNLADETATMHLTKELQELWQVDETFYAWTDDVVFHEDGRYYGHHGSCAHPYSEWLQAFDEHVDSWMAPKEGGYAYFYKPRIPDNEQSKGQQLLLGDVIIYNLDWRELIYQMALDYFKYGKEDNFLSLIRENNMTFYPTGYTGYEQYYTDIEGFWRELYDPHLARIELKHYEKINLHSQEEYDEAYKKYKQIYEKRDNEYLFLPANHTYSSHVTYCIYHSDDRAEYHPYQYYYQQDENGKYIMLEDDDVTVLNPVDSKTKYYYKIGNNYFSYQNYSAGTRYYTHHVYRNSSLLDPDEIYYDRDGEKREEEYVYIWTIAKEFNEHEKYYLYEADTGSYILQKDLTGFAPKHTYFFQKKHPLIHCSDADLYVDKYYQPVQTIVPGKTYYIQDFDLVEVSDGTYDYNYFYKPVFTLEKDIVYCYTVNNIEYEATSFTKGMTYYPKGKPTETIVIPKLNLYYYEGLQKIEYKHPLTVDDISYYFDDNNNMHQISASKGYIILGRPTYYYKDVTAEVNKDTFEEGDLYIYINTSIGFTQYRILKKFNKHKQYWKTEGDEYTLNTASFKANVDYYVNLIGTDIYIKYANFLDFDKPIDRAFMCVIDDQHLYSTAHTTSQDYVTGQTHNFAEVDRVNAKYNPNLVYYLYGSDNKMHPLFEHVTQDNWSKIWFALYIKPVNTYTLVKHISYAPEGTIIDKDGQQIVLSYQYSSCPDYNTTTFWTYKTERPEELNFWFDFLDSDGELSQYANYVIGNRPKAENDTKVNAIYYRDTPNVIFVDNTISDDDFIEQKLQKPGYTFMRLTTAIKSLFNISAQGKTAQAKIDALLYSNTYCTEVISITCLPVYHLKPNTRIFIKDDNSGINGEYIITKITSPLSFNGMMTISAAKAVERIY